MSILSFAKKLTRSNTPASPPTDSKKKHPPAGGKKKPAVAEKKPAEVKAAPAGAGMLDLTPVVTEKSIRLQENNVVTFRVPHTVTAGEIAQAITARFNVQPHKVRIVRGHGKRRRRGQTLGQTAQWKKAYVQVDDVTVFTSNS